MTSVAFPSLSIRTKAPDGTTYSYLHVKPADEKPYILFLHGFPSSSYDWRHQVTYFSEEGYGLIVPDLLGYGDTDKPRELEAYRLRKMAEEIVSLLDAQQVDKAVGVGHDWGSVLLSRLVNYFPERFSKCAFLAVGYGAPSGPFSVDSINKSTEKALGYPIFGYWDFFNSEDTAELLDRNAECTHSLWYAANPVHVKLNLCPIGATRDYIEQGKTAPLAHWITTDEIAMHDRIFDSSNGGHGPPLNWYKAQVANLNVEDEKAVKRKNMKIRQPTLFVSCEKDYVAIGSMIEPAMRHWVKDMRVVKLDAGHMPQLEKREELNEALQEFVDGTPEEAELETGGVVSVGTPVGSLSEEMPSNTGI